MTPNETANRSRRHLNSDGLDEQETRHNERKPPADPLPGSAPHGT